MRWWSALALLRSLGSSPAAAAATLRSRADNAEARTVEEADELGRRAVLDQAGDEDAESLDVAPGARYQDDRDDGRERAQDRGYAGLRGSRDDAAAGRADDPKLQAAVKLVDELLAGRVTTRSSSAASSRPPNTSPSTYASICPSAGRTRWRSMPSPAPSPPPSARSASPSSPHDRRVLVATDCLSRGHQPAGRLRRRRPLRPVLEPDPPRAARGPRRPLRPTRADRARRHLLRRELADRRDRARRAAAKAPAIRKALGSRRPGADRLRGRDRRDPRRADHPRPIRRERVRAALPRDRRRRARSRQATRPRMAGRRRTRTQDPHPVRPAHDPARRGPPRADR